MTDGPPDALEGSEAAEPTHKPLIVLCAPEHPDLLETQFARYAHEYDVRTTASAAETSALLQGLAHEGQVAMLVSETEVPDAHVMLAFHSWRALVPTAKRIIAAHVGQFRTGPMSCVMASPPASTTPTC